MIRQLAALLLLDVKSTGVVELIATRQGFAPSRTTELAGNVVQNSVPVTIVEGQTTTVDLRGQQ